MRKYYTRSLIRILSLLLIGCGTEAVADPVSPAGWTANLPLGASLPEGLYFVNEPYFLARTGPHLAPGIREVDGLVNIPVLLWSTPATLLGGHLEVAGFAPALGLGINPGATNGTSSSHVSIYNPAGLVGLAWSLGSGWSFVNWVGGFAPVSTDIGNNIGLGGNFFTFVEIAALALNQDSWSLNANLIYLHSGSNLSTGIHQQPDTIDVDFAVVKHIEKFEIGLVGSATTDLTDTVRNRFGAARSSQVSLGGLVGYQFDTVNVEILATRSVAAAHQVAGGYDTRVYGRITIPLWNPAPAEQAAVVKARY
ncbi:transporter [Methylobacterium sp. J-048]|uniref:transporter n=1 Tax=Methylobacterium sp. J-048 TaxID=2836635 RepID=UPI001FBB88C4|nr:transporter [Methylobacterium sp. J-048]MCJ2059571.1 transporter [Methylobacterium sp. J-048]